MNVSPYSLGPKLLTEVVPDSAVISITLLEHPEDPGCWELQPIEEIHARADAMTPLLKGILEIHPGSHWGLNE
jgi:hypothetical protein